MKTLCFGFLAVIFASALVPTAGAADKPHELKLVAGDTFTYRVFFRDKQDTLTKVVTGKNDKGNWVLNVTSAGGKNAVEVYSPFGALVSGVPHIFWWKDGDPVFYKKISAESHNGIASPDMSEGAKWEHKYDVANSYGRVTQTRLVDCTKYGGAQKAKEHTIAAGTFVMKEIKCEDRIHDKFNGQMVTSRFDQKTGFSFFELREWGGENPGKVGYELTSIKLMPRPQVSLK